MLLHLKLHNFKTIFRARSMIMHLKNESLFLRGEQELDSNAVKRLQFIVSRFLVSLSRTS